MGKTTLSISLGKQIKKHPHGRGEDLRSTHTVGSCTETPPRAWGRQKNNKKEFNKKRNTPTGVGKTFISPCTPFLSKKHPHGRGEDLENRTGSGIDAETPPRAWGRLCPGWSLLWSVGNTPTGVGKTIGKQDVVVNIKKHPHGRGEDVA